MRKMIVEETRNTPKISLDPHQGKFSMSGKSFPENAKKFYEPILDWFDQFDPPANVKYVFDFELSYVSSSSIISVFEILKKIGKMQRNGMQMNVVWRYEEDDEDIRKIGEDFMKLIDLPFELLMTPVSVDHK